MIQLSTTNASEDLGTYLKTDLNRRSLCCGTAKLVGFSLALSHAQFGLAQAPAIARPSAVNDFIRAGFDGLDPDKLWDTHFHVLGIGDSGSGCWINPTLSQ